MPTTRLFTDHDVTLIKNAIAAAEKRTSGELKVYIDDQCKSDVLEKALLIFRKLNMHQTKLQNGVLIYVAIKDHKLAIIGDTAIHQQVTDNFWQSTRNLMLDHFAKGDYVNGLIHGIDEAGKALQTYFPVSADDSNELSNDVIFGS